MTAAALIEQAGADGMKLWADGERLAYEGPADVVELWKPRIVASKPEIMLVLQSATPSTWWRMHYPDRDPVKVWTNPPATQFQILKNRPDADAAEPIIEDRTAPVFDHPKTKPEPTILARSCSTCTHVTYRGGCGVPVEAKLSALEGVICYHPAGGLDCPVWKAQGSK